MRRTLMTTVLGIALLAASAPALAYDRGGGEIDRRGVYLGFAGMGNFVVNQSSAPVDGFIGQGGGFGLFLGFRIAPMFALMVAGLYQTAPPPVATAMVEPPVSAAP